MRLITLSNRAFLGAVALGAAAFCATPSSAVTLRQQWMPDQQLTYETTLTGTATLLADDESPQPWAGLPTDFHVRGNAAMTLNTLAADEAGVGTVALSLGDSRLRAQGFGQIFEVTVRNGQVAALMNGKASESAKAINNVAEPNWALRVTPEGLIQGTATLNKPGRAPQAGNNLPGAVAAPFDLAGAAQSWMLRAFPALWPQGDVKTGDSWTAPITVPLPPAAAKANEAAPPSPTPLRIGEITFTLRGEEEVAGRKAQRVALSGAFDVDAAKAKTINDATRNSAPVTAPAIPTPGPKKNEPFTTQELADAKQKITGDLWLDIASGQLMRADLTMQTHLHSKGIIKNKAGRTRPTEDWADFTGALQMQLRKVSYASAGQSGAAK